MDKGRDQLLVAALVALLAGVATAPPAGAVELCQNHVSDINHPCFTQAEMLEHLPCGVTRNDSGDCYRYHTSLGCTFAIGDWEDPNFIAVWWPSKPAPAPGAPKPKPSDGECQALEQSVPVCREEPYDPGCPDQPVSDDDCQIFCDFRPSGGDSSRFWGDSDDFWSEWGEGCRAFALMPEGWRRNPWLPAQGFFTVGRAFPVEAFAWESEDGAYGAEQALADGRLGRTVLGGVGRTPLWGAKDGVIERDWRRLVREAGVCVNEPGAVLASPFWSPERGIRRFPALVKCSGAAQKGLHLWATAAGWDDATWDASGAKIEDVVPRLQKLEGHGLELVCVTPDLAQERRRQRRAGTETSRLP